MWTGVGSPQCSISRESWPEALSGCVGGGERSGRGNMEVAEAARNIKYALESVGVDEDIALCAAYRLIAEFIGRDFQVGSDFYQEYVATATDLLN